MARVTGSQGEAFGAGVVGSPESERSNPLLESVLQNLPGLAYRCLNDRPWTNLYMSEGFRDLSGYDPSDVLDGRITYAELIHPEDRDRVWDEIQSAVAAHCVYRIEYRMIKPDGSVVWVWEQGQGVYDEQGHVKYLDGVVIDATSRALAQRESAESEDKFRRLFELASDAVVMVDGHTGRLLEANPSAAAMFGWSREELLALSILDVSVDPERAMLALATRPRHIDHAWMKEKDGTPFPVEMTLNHFEWKGRPVHLAAIRDIGERLQEQEAIKQSEQMLRAVLDVTPFPVALVDADDDVIEYWSRSALDLFGHTAPTASEWYSVAYPDPEYRREAVARWRRAVRLARSAPGRAVNAGEHRITCRDGSIRACELYAAFIGDRLVVTFNDVTERNQAAEAAQASGRLFERLFAHAGDAIYLARQDDGHVVDCNLEACRQLGYERQELLGLTVFDIEEQVPVTEIERIHAGLTTNGVMTVSSENRRKDGSAFPAEVRLVLLPDTIPPLMLAVIRDVSEREAAAAELRASEERFRTLVEEAPFAILVQRDGVYRYANRAACSLYADSPDASLVGRRVMEFIAPEYREAIRQRMEETARGGSLDILQNDLITLDGRRVVIEASAVPITYEGEPSALVFVADITERLRNEEALRLTQFSVDRASDAVFWSGHDARITYVSDSLCRSLGYSPEELRQMTIYDLDPTLTLERWNEVWRVLREKGSLVFEAVHRAKTGEVFPVEVATNHVVFGDREFNCAFVRDVTQRKRAEAETSRLSQIVEQSQNEIYVFDAVSLKFVAVNQVARENLGYSTDELLCLTPVDLKPEFASSSFEELLAPLRAGTLPIVRFTTRHMRKDGSRYPVEVHLRLYPGDPNSLFVANITDITDMVQAEEQLRLRDEQLRQSQKMEAVGRLAGGIAHDFNNLLTAILGYSELILATDQVSPDLLRADVQEIKQAADRAKDLTAQILAFSRKQPHRPRVVKANDLVVQLEPLMRRTLREDIDLVCRLAPDAGAIEVDSGQFSQVLVNMAVNARDAMPDGGLLRLETSRLKAEGVEWLCLRVTDTGCGMDASTLEQMFEPFFTTKSAGEGTGLGLSTVYGIVSQSGGRISASSEQGRGTTFTVLLPSVPESSAGETDVEWADVPAVAAPRPQGGASILVVEDEPAVRAFTGRVLTEHGYQVLLAADGSQALTLAQNSALAIDALITDVILPGELHGDEVARRIRELRPGLACLFMSGYPREKITRAGRLADGVNYMEKPFTAELLVRRIKEVLDGER